MSDEQVKLDALVVGGGPAGLAAALTMARQGMEVGVLERGDSCGSKNVSGLLYTTVLSDLLPDYLDSAPLERPVSRRTLAFLDGEAHWSATFGAEAWSAAPCNHTHVVHRPQFDRWFAEQTEEAGASILDSMVVEGLVYEGDGPGKRAVGVQVRDDEPLYADAIVLADGANCLVTESAISELGLAKGKKPQTWALGVKQIVALPREKIEDRFNLDPHEGCALDFFGSPFEGLVGGGFLYTGRETVGVGFAAKAESFAARKLKPREVLDAFCRHPVVRKYLQGGELIEYSCHMIPESGYLAIPELIGNGVLIAGDAAGLVNMSLYHEGSNHAMASGRAAGQTAAKAHAAGDFSKAALQPYVSQLQDTFVMKDMAKYQEIPEIMDALPELFSLYPRKLCSLLIDFFTVSQQPKADTQKAAIRKFFAGLPKLQGAHNLWKARKLV
ncbi:MAG: FAD-dependent oxidoreductase [Armatimonadetes bacterium CG_4_10_14_3_um_filter_66_18]|nr:FAD-dependent oxidoreductase [Armatimonadota bacterium]OIP10391.1 MAG: hypothetical protein AUJ96_03880 [Armatimonadetes bacterium CG2_30_66_41]PIU91493.1 MAG: FAD-dependent oxidoreductase [Armatimonadetes bacterium CG06_land_8_20_14_3_00_66_21]PIX36983.1 MAG: FAD-dependent oxidoreductase [Armatimonadetes bacterium CG_4_8_14_3_um_filter_66_20]PIY51205.1 MAG: FAD-dependent oxidoreductase [Armatimonadetes bacterium CG_4_10_14_3_um_filter_66_18]PIZ32434.1 MAG: FAD-dependent oxidoreductase [Arm